MRQSAVRTTNQKSNIQSEDGGDEPIPIAKNNNDNGTSKKLNRNNEIFVPMVMCSRFGIESKIGSGGFGQIYLAYDTSEHKKVALKVESETGKSHLHPEVLFYRVVEDYTENMGILQACPKCHFFGAHGSLKVAAFDLMGPSLSDLFCSCQRQFSLKSVLMLAIQLLTVIESVHRSGIVHRDIKPGNFVMGLDTNANRVYTIDFGLSSFWHDGEGQHIPFKSNVNFRGTHRYASINSHMKRELSRRDDLEALAYVLIYFLKGSLPWQSLNVARNRRRAAIGKFKLAIGVEELASDIPFEFGVFLLYSKQLDFEDEPNYDYCRRLFRDCLRRHSLRFDCVYDWSRQQQKQQTLAHPPSGGGLVKKRVASDVLIVDHMKPTIATVISKVPTPSPLGSCSIVAPKVEESATTMVGDSVMDATNVRCAIDSSSGPLLTRVRTGGETLKRMFPSPLRLCYPPFGRLGPLVNSVQPTNPLMMATWHHSLLTSNSFASSATTTSPSSDLGINNRCVKAKGLIGFSCPKLCHEVSGEGGSGEYLSCPTTSTQNVSSFTMDGTNSSLPSWHYTPSNENPFVTCRVGSPSTLSNSSTRLVYKSNDGGDHCGPLHSPSSCSPSHPNPSDRISAFLNAISTENEGVINQEGQESMVFCHFTNKPSVSKDSIFGKGEYNSIGLLHPPPITTSDTVSSLVIATTTKSHRGGGILNESNTNNARNVLPITTDDDGRSALTVNIQKATMSSLSEQNHSNSSSLQHVRLRKRSIQHVVSPS